MNTTACPPRAERITKSLLGYGVIAGPIYVTVAAIEAVTRDGFDPTRHAVSQLSNGSFGWIQIANFVVVGAMTVAGAVGIGRAMGWGVLGRWTAALLSGYGTSLIAAGWLRADASDGFPPGTPSGAGTMSWHGMGHFLAGGVGFLCLVCGGFVMASSFARDGELGWANYTRITVTVFAAAFVLLATGIAGSVGIVLFTVVVVWSWAWLSIVSVKLYRTTGSVETIEYVYGIHNYGSSH